MKQAVQRGRSWFRANPLTVDLLLYLGCFGYALVVAMTNEFYGFRVWGGFAAAGYGLAFGYSGWLALTARSGGLRPGWWRSRWPGVALAALLAMIVPLVVLVIRRLTGNDWLFTPWSWSAQPEVWVIERSASLLIEHGTPYLDVLSLGRPPEVNDYTPYGPVMTVFGLPRALFGGTPLADALTDARLMFALTACLCLLAVHRLLGRPAVPIRAVQFAVVFPLTALNWSTQGPDLAMLGLLLLAVALAARDRPIAAGLVMALVLSAKLIVAPAAVVVAVLILARCGKRAAGGFLLTLITACTVAHVPVLLADPQAFVEHLIKFPAGMGVVTSPAASPLPGYLIASIGPAGKVLAFVLLGMAAVAMLGWLYRRPPVTGNEALLRIAVGLGAFTLLTPATRYGYLVYPLVLLGAMCCFQQTEATGRTVNSPTG